MVILEKNDFGSGTSTKSSKLVHGGIRYLEKAIKKLDKKEYLFVKESLKERAIFLENIHAFSEKIKLNTPISSYFELFYTYLGLTIYKILAGKRSLGDNSYLNKVFFPLLKKDTLGAVSFYDGKFLDFRVLISLLQTAQSFSCIVKNYHEVNEFFYKKGKICGLKVKDILNGKIYKIETKLVINATGPSLDKIRKLNDKNAKDILELSSGIHIVLDKKFLFLNEGLVLPKTKDNRIIFILPFLDSCLVGTTDNKATYTDTPFAKEKEIDYLLFHLNKYFKIKIKKSDIKGSFSGLRPLLKDENKISEDQTRDFRILKEKGNLISLAGGKWTIYRKMAEVCLNFIERNNLLEKKEKCKTKKLKLLSSYGSEILVVLDSFNVNKTIKRRLLELYGSRAIEVLNIASLRNDFKYLGNNNDILNVEIIYCIKYEFIKKPIDFLARRIGLCLINKEKSLKLLLDVTNIMAKELFWSNEKKQLEYLFSKEEINKLF